MSGPKRKRKTRVIGNKARYERISEVIRGKLELLRENRREIRFLRRKQPEMFALVYFGAGGIVFALAGDKIKDTGALIGIGIVMFVMLATAIIKLCKYLYLESSIAALENHSKLLRQNLKELYRERRNA